MIPLKYFWARTIFVVCISIVFKLFVHLDTAGTCYLTRNYIIKERKRGTRQVSFLLYPVCKAITTPYQTAGVGGGEEKCQVKETTRKRNISLKRKQQQKAKRKLDQEVLMLIGLIREISQRTCCVLPGEMFNLCVDPSTNYVQIVWFVFISFRNK